MEALPRALRVYHDRVGETGYSPYQLVYGRDRPVQGLPYEPLRHCEEAIDYLHRMHDLDTLVAIKLNELHAQHTETHNRTVPEKTRYQPGDRVWVLRPKQVGGHKLETW